MSGWYELISWWLSSHATTKRHGGRGRTHAPYRRKQPVCLCRAACLVHLDAKVIAIQSGVMMLYISHVLSTVSSIITSCPESSHILPHAVCLAPYPGSAAS